MSMNTNQKLKQIRDLLLDVDAHVYHYEAPSKPEKLSYYIVWAEDMECEPFYSDNGKTGMVMQGTIDLFTKQEFDPLIDAIQNVLAENKIGSRISAVQYEDETQFIHYTWDFEL